MRLEYEVDVPGLRDLVQVIVKPDESVDELQAEDKISLPQAAIGIALDEDAYVVDLGEEVRDSVVQGYFVNHHGVREARQRQNLLNSTPLLRKDAFDLVTILAQHVAEDVEEGRREKRAQDTERRGEGHRLGILGVHVTEVVHGAIVVAPAEVVLPAGVAADRAACQFKC